MNSIPSTHHVLKKNTFPCSVVKKHGKLLEKISFNVILQISPFQQQKNTTDQLLHRFFSPLGESSEICQALLCGDSSNLQRVGRSHALFPFYQGKLGEAAGLVVEE